MKKIFVNTKILQYRTTGVQRYLLELIDELPKYVNKIQPRVRKEGVLGHWWEQTDLLKRTALNVLWSPSNTGPLLHPRQVVTLHDMVSLDHPEWLSRQFAQWYRWLTPRLAQTARHIITVSEYSKSRIVHHSGISPDKITVTLLAADRRFTPRSGHETRPSLEPLNLPSSRYVLSIGSIEPRKNTVRLLEAWRDIQAQLEPDLWLVVTGAKGRSQVFSEVGLSEIPPRVHFTDHVPDEVLPYLYAGATAFVYPSLYEGFGLPPLEAMASGVPVITSNTTSLPEVVGDAAITVNPLSTDALAGAMLRLLEDPELRSRLTGAGLQRAQRFSWREAAGKTLDILERVAHE